MEDPWEAGAVFKGDVGDTLRGGSVFCRAPAVFHGQGRLAYSGRTCDDHDWAFLELLVQTTEVILTANEPEPACVGQAGRRSSAFAVGMALGVIVMTDHYENSP